MFFPMITEWVRRSRNHPSLILRSLGNELQFDEKYSGFPSDDGGITTYRLFDTVTKRWDATRPTTVAMYPARDNGILSREKERFKAEPVAPRLALVTDVASFNYDYQSYGAFFAQKKDLILFQSEATVRELLRPFWGMDRARTVGLAYWGAVDYWGESYGWPKKGWTYSFFSRTLEPKPSAWLVKSAFQRDPVARLCVYGGETKHMWNDNQAGFVHLSDDWNRGAGERVTLLGFTNAETGELFVNGRSFGTRTNDQTSAVSRNILRWNGVPWEQGRAELVCRNAGQEVARHALESTGPAVEVRCELERQEWMADGRDLAYLRILAVDAQGRRVHAAENEVRMTVTGPASLLALDNGDPCTESLLGENVCRLRDGFALAIVRSERGPGLVDFAIDAGALGSAELKVSTLKRKRRSADE